MTLTSSLEDRWNQLHPDPQRPVFQLVDSHHPLAFYLGCAPSGERLLLLVTPEKPVIGREFKAVRIEVFAREDGNWSLLIALQKRELAPVFGLLCEDLIEVGRRVPSADNPLAFVLRRLALWQRLLERGGSGLLSESAVRGLVGELAFLVIDRIPAMGARAAIECWNGPLGADQDFQAAAAAWEVKSVRVGSESIQIASERQLYAPTRDLHLIVICLEDCAAGAQSASFSLNGLVEHIRGIVGADFDSLELFDSRMVEAGYVKRPEYDSPNVQIPWMKRFLVTAAFPRLVMTDLPKGIGELRYEIRLEALEPFLSAAATNVGLTHDA